MESLKGEKGVNLTLSNDEALVFLEWLYRLNKGDYSALFQDQAEQRIIFDLEAILEQVIPDTFEENYSELLSRARERVRDEA